MFNHFIANFISRVSTFRSYSGDPQESWNSVIIYKLIFDCQIKVNEERPSHQADVVTEEKIHLADGKMKVREVPKAIGVLYRMAFNILHGKLEMTISEYSSRLRNSFWIFLIEIFKSFCVV